MTFNLADVQPKPNNWFASTLKYKGWGHADFLDPEGWIEGPTTAIYDQSGKHSIIMRPRNFFCKEAPSKYVFQLLDSEGDFNKCTRLTIRTDQGIFFGIDHIFFSYSYKVTHGSGEFNKSFVINFFLQEAYFDSSFFQASPKYWVLPLGNFLSDFNTQTPELAHHPLRLLPSIDLPSNIPNDQKESADFVANQFNRLIVFEFKKKIGFIEPLSNYNKSSQDLLSGKKKYLLTSVMVSEILGESIDKFQEVEKWFPIDFLHLLGLCTGSEVGSPWIEFRDENGNLIRRIHIVFGNAPYIRGRKAIQDILHKGIGVLLTQAPLSQHWKKTYLRVVLRNVIRGGFTQEVLLEERLSYLIRGFETLCKEFGLAEIDLISFFETSEKNLIMDSINHHSKEFSRQIKSSPSIKLDSKKITCIEKIKSRMLNAANKENDFGLSVYQLLKMFELNDAIIMDRYLNSQNSSNRTNNFAGMLSMYRGKVIHEGYFDDLQNYSKRENILTLISHLHDMLLRILLKMLGYTGYYCPSTLKNGGIKELDWVGNGLTEKDLGYKNEGCI